MIKLKCSNENCNYCYEVSEAEYKEYAGYHSHCFMCGSQLIVDLGDVVEKDLYQRAEAYIDKWVAEIGWDNTIDLIKRNDNQACYRIYKEILQKKGFNLK